MRLIAGDDSTPWLNYRVLLDGVELPLCSEADDAEGWAICDIPLLSSRDPVARRALTGEDLETGALVVFESPIDIPATETHTPGWTRLQSSGQSVRIRGIITFEATDPR